ncbi:MAG: SPOR domain-containing protein [Pseudomonadota bacterium]
MVRTAPAKAAPAPKTAKRVARAAPTCPEASTLSQQYLRGGDKLVVRCGPQTQPHTTVISGGGGSGAATRVVRAAPAPTSTAQPVIRTVRSVPLQTATPKTVSPTTRIAPRHVYQNQLASTDGIFVPEGYQRVWDDDRLNPRRAHQNFQGKAQMDVAWTRTVPRILIDRKTGREVTYKYPGLQYPYTSFAQQRAAGVTVSTRGQVVQDPQRVVRMRDGSLKRVASASVPKRKVKVAKRKVTTSTPTFTTRSRVVAPKKTAQAASHRYVQAGMFADPANAKRAAQIIAKSGLPARTGKLTRKGKAYTLVLAGPFQTQNQLTSALGKVRRAGFADAFPRK